MIIVTVKQMKIKKEHFLVYLLSVVSVSTLFRDNTYHPKIEEENYLIYHFL